MMALNEDNDFNAPAPVASNKGNPYRLSPYNGNILPNTPDRLKLYIVAIKSLDKDKHWTLNVKNGLKSSLVYFRQLRKWAGNLLL